VITAAPPEEPSFTEASDEPAPGPQSTSPVQRVAFNASDSGSGGRRPPWEWPSGQLQEYAGPPPSPGDFGLPGPGPSGDRNVRVASVATGIPAPDSSPSNVVLAADRASTGNPPIVRPDITPAPPIGGTPGPLENRRAAQPPELVGRYRCHRFALTLRRRRRGWLTLDQMRSKPFASLQCPGDTNIAAIWGPVAQAYGRRQADLDQAN
jgi:hypothetical protein